MSQTYLFPTTQNQLAHQKQSQFQAPTDRADIYKLVYGNGQNKPATIVFHEDGGHGWIQVPHALITKLGIGAQISGYSYRDSNYAYLEEDCDLSLFMTAAGVGHDQPLFKDWWQIVPTEYKEHSPIRRKQSYR